MCSGTRRRADLLSSFTGHPQSRAHAEAVASARLAGDAPHSGAD